MRVASTVSGLPRSRMTFRDLFGEVIAGIVQRPARAILTALGTVLGVAVLISVLGLTTSASAQIGKRFDPAVANEVSVTSDTDHIRAWSYTFRPDAEERVAALRGVVHAGIGWMVEGAKSLSNLPPSGGGRGLTSVQSWPRHRGFFARRGSVSVPGPLTRRGPRITSNDSCSWGRRSLGFSGSHGSCRG